MNAIILLGRGGYGSAPKEQMDRLVAALAERTTDRVYPAFVDGASPSLPDALERCAGEPITRVLIVPIYMPTDHSLQAWVTKVVRRWLLHHPDPPFTIAMGEVLADSGELAEAVRALIARLEAAPPPSLEASGVQPNSPEWSVLIPHTHHVLVCRGPRCNTAGAGSVMARLSEQLDARGLDDSDVLVAQTGCLFPCNLGPILIVYPERVWYCGLDEGAVNQIVERHLVGGQVVEHYIRQPATGAQQRPQGEA